jgi:hypothetical protein
MRVGVGDVLGDAKGTRAVTGGVVERHEEATLAVVGKAAGGEGKAGAVAEMVEAPETAEDPQAAGAAALRAVKREEEETDVVRGAALLKGEVVDPSPADSERTLDSRSRQSVVDEKLCAREDERATLEVVAPRKLHQR